MITPLRDVLVLRPLAQPGKVGLLHMPDTGRQKNKTGVICEVLAAGPDSVLAKPGDQVSVDAYGSHPAGEQFAHGGETLTLIRERDIHGVLT